MNDKLSLGTKDKRGDGPPGSLRLFWQQRSTRERRVLAFGGLLLALMLLWLLAIEPALEGRERWRAALPQLRADAAQAQALAQQLAAAPPAAAAGAAPAVDRATLENQLNAALKAQGITPQSLDVQQAGDALLVRVNFSDVSFSALTEWLQKQQRSAQLSVSDANVTARERLDRVDARLTLRRQR